jgi:hypothetical protein
MGRPGRGERLVATVGAVRFLSPDTVEVEAGLLGGPLNASGGTYVVERGEDSDWRVTGVNQAWIS